MTFSALTVFALALAVAAGSPGPSIAALVARVLTGGLRSVLPFLAAMWLGEVLWLTMAVAGLAAIAQSFHAAFVVLKYLGVAYLLYLAWRMWTAPAGPDAAALPTRRNAWGMFTAGMMITLGNPKIMVFYMALLPTIIDMSAIGLASWAELVATLLAVLVAVDLGWALMAAKARRLLTSPRAVRIANRAGAGMMAGAAAAIARS
ncbi:LysE family translocator [Marinivivus vitaminiproducens]|uniref:LysE family translocator n=1 Tax=Marinivivus vitaminiproducens TaxID=3035935 RepID=UPI0027A8BB0F|nr:LysE family translocator [Geminicoccaceae bacterium SCSIO 64248]